ncbi:DUF2059 domain-containing protein [Tranquillimonas rosea]|uniref:DUF2059 domain-containing protein n=1 Tax=Tranquillimonas rosea TaxID=641238 RepID=UPI003BAAAD27
MRLALALLCATAAAPPVLAQQTDADALYDALDLGTVIEVMREEGLDYGEDLGQDLLGGQGGTAWTNLVDGLYDTGRMGDIVRARFTQELSDVDTAPLVEFFNGDLGQRVIRLENEARQALTDEEIEDAAAARVTQMRADDDPRIDLIGTFIEANDLVESNVVGAMNSNYAFYTGLLDGDVVDGGMTEEQALSDVWAQEEAIREDTRDWVYSYLTLAYQPLSDEELNRYIDISRTDAGQAMNQALFDAFDEMYVDLSRRLGEGAARMMASEDI